MANQINPEQDNRELFNVKEFSSKFRTKKEVYDFLTQDVKAYCPPRDTVTIWHLKDLIQGTKKKILYTEVKHLEVPHYDNLALNKILPWLQ